jgi:hypothetical protein
MSSLHSLTARAPDRHLLLLKWLLLATGMLVGLALAAHLGLLHRLVLSDRTGITWVIAALLALGLVHGGCHVVRLSRVLNHARALEAWIGRHGGRALSRALQGHDPDGAPPPGCIAEHLQALARKALLGGGGPVGLDQRPLLEAFAGRLGRGRELGWFLADLLLSLGLLGTVIGFILMLAPVAGLDAGDAAATREALGAISAGMAVALSTTLAGLIASLLLRVQGYLLDSACEEVVRRASLLAELHLLPVLARETADAA